MFTLPKLSYSYDALEPYIDAQTMELHLHKHHQTYVDNLNKCIQAHPELQSKSLQELLDGFDTLPDSAKPMIRNHAGGHYNHSLFWQMMRPGGSNVQGSLHYALQKKFGSYEQFVEVFEQAAKRRFGSGWAFLVLNKAGDLEVISIPNQDATLLQGAETVLALDVWEHAYYLKYQNRRPDYIKAWFNVVDWDFVQQRYETVR